MPLTYNTTMDYQGHDATIDSFLDIEMKAREVNENLLFNTEMLNLCREQCKHLICVDVAKHGGKMISDSLELIDMRTVHPAGKEIKNQKTGEVLSKGFQIRSLTNIDNAHKTDILEDILNEDWLPSAPQIVLFRLPEEYQYVRNDGIRVVWGIIDGAHRFDAADDANEEHIVAWLVDMEISKIRKFANAELNRVKYGAKSRTNEDIAASVIMSYKDETSDLYAKIQNAKEGESNQILIDEIKTYHIKDQTAGKILRIIMHDPDVVVDRKEYDSKRMTNYIAEHRVTWTKTKESDYDYISDKGVRIIVTQASGSNHVIVAHQICKLMQVSNDPISVVFATAITDKLNKNNALEKRQAFKRKVLEVIKTMGQGYRMMYEDMTGVNPNWLCFPELSDEFEDGMINIM